METPKYNVVNNPEKKRFEVEVEGKLAICEYIHVGKNIIFTHTEVPVGLEGRGIASAMAKTALQFARDNNLRVQPLCPYIAGYMEKHPETHDLLKAGFRLG